MNTTVDKVKNVVTRNIYVSLSASASADQINFNEIFSITDPNIAPQAFAMAQVFQQALVPTDDKKSLRFDVQTAINLIKKHPEMAVINFTDQVVEQSNSAVQLMVDKVLEILSKVLGVVLGAAPKQKLTESIASAFTGLDEQKNDAWIFWEHTTAHKTTYQYNILFGVQSKETGLFLYGLPMGMEITVDIEKEKVLFITLKDKESYRVHLQSLSVVEMIKAHCNLKLAAKAGGKDPHQEAQEFFALQKKKEPVRI
ncbi:TPA: cytolytic delta-endotoxin (insecticidal protein) [Aeromonas salmonicida]|uniref:cytolytic delta-endotoxin (insecticidal protein) n=1 Tax=Aeromonas salmonicida TaxID=645 RepID=UPI0005BE4920|nr:cytolytic delta-endotoxin (insecticidal protein) [Aeromonas salmonicida]OAH81271.1 cytolytic delta-endotoxin (insecticidal protein) [Aeromonas salmonicida subsp. salmonicida]SPT74197.1 cytolytic delta-endotoxin (insecticidal protein) [Aeromonas salmonicida]HDN9774799.1 cytolytic delta-endotoxin (insecticidal protein) [Aeromonas salmonicida]HDN9783782.1 cytolytic delta-endotoxin (insecticidal protein) [Aeromonas salmonicida]HDO0287503.1 cytolytic delta-endotoxin (insecticidal protein) [Aerom